MSGSKTAEEWKKILSSEQYAICRKKGTEPAFSGEFYDFKEKGQFYCICCSSILFSSETKYDSGTGWPSFWEPFSEESVETQEDLSVGMRRIEVHCKNCKAHLGHVFPDGPEPTGLRYCINSVSLDLKPKNSRED